ncbi:MAG: DNA-3-methyladenine glycosylase I [Actinomycetia bacterium]|nr:DNA-3-methyladenine glycosylase I [Actinomycetes bacterium]
MEPEKPKSYCEFVENLEKSNVHRIYHDTQYGFPITSDNELFGRLVLEINQAGLSWTTILNKQENFRKAYSEFDVKKVASFNNKNIEKLLSDTGIIRNKLKINAAIFNAQKIVDIQSEHGSFKIWLDYSHPLQLDEWVELFKKTFKFTGGEITKEFLISTGYLSGAHEKDCPIFSKIIREGPMWEVFDE